MIPLTPSSPIFAIFESTLDRRIMHRATERSLASMPDDGSVAVVVEGAESSSAPLPVKPPSPGREYFWNRTSLWLLPDGRIREERVWVNDASSPPHWLVTEVHADAMLEVPLGPYHPPVLQARLERFRSGNWDAIGAVYQLEALALLDPPELMRSCVCDIALPRAGTVLEYPVRIYRIRAVPETPGQPFPPHLGDDVEVYVTEDGRFVLGWDVLFEGEVVTRARAVHLDLDARFDETVLFSEPPDGRGWY